VSDSLSLSAIPCPIPFLLTTLFPQTNSLIKKLMDREKGLEEKVRILQK
jgi:hypothetical protein